MKRAAILAMVVTALGIGSISFADSKSSTSGCGCEKKQGSSQPVPSNPVPRPWDPAIDGGW